MPTTASFSPGKFILSTVLIAVSTLAIVYAARKGWNLGSK